MLFSFFIGACTKSYDFTFDGDTQDTALHEQTQDIIDCVPKDPLSSQEVPPFYLGAKVFTMHPEYQSITQPEDFSALSMNSAGILFALPYGDDGEIYYPYDYFGVQYQTFEDQLCQIGNLVHTLKSAGIHIYLSIEPHYYDKSRWPELWDEGHSGPPKLTAFEDPSVLEVFLERSPDYIAEIATHMERYDVDFLAPITEPSKYFEHAPINDYMREVREAIQNHSDPNYSGSLVWQVYGLEFHEPNWEDLLFRYDFRGYDVLGLAVLGCDQPYESWIRYMDTLLTWAQEDGVTQHMHAEFGCVGSVNSIETAQDNFNGWYNYTEPDSLGLFMLEAPHHPESEEGIMGSWMGSWIQGIAQEQGLE